MKIKILISFFCLFSSATLPAQAIEVSINKIAPQYTLNDYNNMNSLAVFALSQPWEKLKTTTGHYKATVYFQDFLPKEYNEPDFVGYDDNMNLAMVRATMVCTKWKCEKDNLKKDFQETIDKLQTYSFEELSDYLTTVIKRPALISYNKKLSADENKKLTMANLEGLSESLTCEGNSELATQYRIRNWVLCSMCNIRQVSN